MTVVILRVQRFHKHICRLHFYSPALICFLVCRCKCMSVSMNKSMCEPVRSYSTVRCSPTPAIFWWTKYSTKEATASSSLLLGPNPSHHPPQCSTYTVHSLFPRLSSKDSSSLAKYMLAIIFHCKRFESTSQRRLAHCSEGDR